MRISDAVMDELRPMATTESLGDVARLSRDARAVFVDCLESGDAIQITLKADDDGNRRLLSMVHAIVRAAEAQRGRSGNLAAVLRCAAYGPEITGDERTFQSILVDTLGSDDYGLLVPGGLDVRRSGSLRAWTCLFGMDAAMPEIPECAEPLLGRRHFLSTKSVYGAFAAADDDPADAIIAVGGFDAAAGITYMSMSSGISLKRLRMSRRDFVSTAVAAARDGHGREEMEWFLRLAAVVGVGDTVVDEVPDIGYVRSHFGLPDDFVIENIRTVGLGFDGYDRMAFDLVKSEWSGISADIGLSDWGPDPAMAVGWNAQSRDLEPFRSWDYDTQSIARRVVRALGSMPDGFGSLVGAIGLDSGDGDGPYAFSYITKIMGAARRSTPKRTLSVIDSILATGDPQRLYRWMLSILEQRLSLTIFHAAISRNPESRATWMKPGMWSVRDAYDSPISIGTARSFFAGRPDDVSGSGPGHSSLTPPAEAMRFVDDGTWPETFTFGRDVFLIPESLRTALSALAPDRWEDVKEIVRDRKGTRRGTLRSMIMDGIHTD